MEDNDEDMYSISDNESIEDILDEEWMKEFEFIETNYDKFYNTDNNKINIYSFFYQNNKIHRMGKEKYDLINKNILTEEELLRIIKIKCEDKYKLDTILRYNIDMKPCDLIDFKNNNENIEQFKYMNRIKSLEPIHFMPSIQMFSDLNTLYLFFKKKVLSSYNTKKIKYTPITNVKRTKRNYK